MIDKQIFYIIQIVLSVILIFLILLQVKGSGLGATFGGELGFYSSRRGVEKMIFKLTIIVSGLFLATATLSLL